jgi:acetolactate synthase I/III small subunit
MMETDKAITYILKLTVRNHPGVLVRCAQVISRRGQNIEKLIVEKINDNPQLYAMEITTFGKIGSVSQIVGQLQKLVDVIEVQ